MRIKSVLFLTVFVLLLDSPAQAQRRIGSISLAEFSNSLQELSSRISPSVVQITATGFGFHNDSEHAGASVLSREHSTGSGVIVSDQGYVMTNAHVVEGARSIRVQVARASNEPDPVFDGKLIGMDRQLDLALLKIEAAGLKALPFGNSTDLKQGELALAFGSPLGMVSKLAILGITVDENLGGLLTGLRIPDGVLVAAQAGISSYYGDQPRQGDIIHAVNGRRITSVDSFRAQLEKLEPEEPLVLQIEREGVLMFLVLENI